jgi:spore maturation protein B
MLTLFSALFAWAIPLLLLAAPIYGYWRRVPVYEAFAEGAEEGLKTAVKIVPFLLGMLVAVSVFRASGAVDILGGWLRPLLNFFGIPQDVFALMLLRPLSGSGALGMATELIRVYGPDSFIGYVASVMQGTTDTTFFVLTVYFGSVGVRKYRHALLTGLSADIVGCVASLWICTAMFTGS